MWLVVWAAIDKEIVFSVVTKAKTFDTDMFLYILQICEYATKIIRKKSWE